MKALSVISTPATTTTTAIAIVDNTTHKMVNKGNGDNINVNIAREAPICSPVKERSPCFNSKNIIFSECGLCVLVGAS